MGAILSMIVGPVASLLRAIVGPLSAFLAGRQIAKAEISVSASKEVVRIQEAQKEALVHAPRSGEQLVLDLRDPSKEF